MILPWNTDAPIYHFPWATIGLIVVNTAVLIAATTGSLENPDDWQLVYGQGWHPVQWITSNFLHEGITHLAGNMLFLWAFGLIVEGKLGWWRFLAIYLILGIAECAIEQSFTQSLEGSSLGASSIIYGLVGMAMFWAPCNEISCLNLTGFRPYQFDVSILTFATCYIVWEFGWTWWSGFAISSSLLHLIGAALGCVLGAVLLKLGAVDCEGWDLFAVLAGREGQARKIQKRAEPKSPSTGQIARQAAAVDQVSKLLADGQLAGAMALDRKMGEQDAAWLLPADVLLALIQALHRQKQWSESIPLMVRFIQRYPEKSTRVRLRLAQVLISTENRPARALQVLEKVQGSSLTEDLQKLLMQLRQRATQMLPDGELEIEGEDW